MMYTLCILLGMALNGFAAALAARMVRRPPVEKSDAQDCPPLWWG